MSSYDGQDVRSSLLLMWYAASHFDGWSKDDADQYIRVGEYGLALDSIAYAYLVNDVLMAADQFVIFQNLATVMQLLNDPEYDGVARLLARANQTPS